MTAICVDDEPILLNWLCQTVSASPDVEHIEKFSDESEALCYAEEHPFDVAFIDIELHETDGLTVAERFRALRPECGIVFCTGHASYAVEAIARLRVDGYLLKPIGREAVQREIDRFKARHQRAESLLTVELAEGVNVFDRNGEPVHFRRRKTEQLLALLVQQNGNSLSARELCELLWNDGGKSQYMYEKNANYLSQLFSDLRHTLEEHDAQDVLKRTTTGYAVCMPLIELRRQK